MDALDTGTKLPPLYLLGAGGLAREAHGLLLQAGLASRFGGFVEDAPPPGRRVHDRPVLDTDALLARGPGARLCAAIGTPARRALVERFVARGFDFETLVHPTALIGPNVQVGHGSLVTAYCVLTADLELGAHVIVNIGAVVAHDVRVGPFSTLSPGVNLNGRVTVGTGVFLGTGATVIPGVQIGDGAVVAAGATVVRDVPPGVTVAGVPARVLVKP